MNKINLDYIINLNGVTINDIKINSINLIEGDWIYLTGDTSIINEFYKFLTCQNINFTGKATVNSIDISNIDDEKVYDVRKSISYLGIDCAIPIDDAQILNHMSLFTEKDEKKLVNSLKEIKSKLSLPPAFNKTKIAQHIYKSLATTPKVLFIEFSFDALSESEWNNYLEALYNYASITGLAIIFCTNNNEIMQKYKSRIYQAGDKQISDSTS